MIKTGEKTPKEYEYLLWSLIKYKYFFIGNTNSSLSLSIRTKHNKLRHKASQTLN